MHENNEFRGRHIDWRLLYTGTRLLSAGRLDAGCLTPVSDSFSRIPNILNQNSQGDIKNPISNVFLDA